VLERLSTDFVRSENAFTRYLRGCDFPNDLPAMGAAVADNVDRYRDYLKMVCAEGPTAGLEAVG